MNFERLLRRPWRSRKKKKSPNNRFNLTKPLSRIVLFASLTYARSAPSPAGAVFQVKRMLDLQNDITEEYEIWDESNHIA